MSDTDKTELGPDRERDTKPPPVPTLEESIAELQSMLADHNALAILARDASARCTDKVTALMARLVEGDAIFKAHARKIAELENRVEHLEKHTGLAVE